METRMHNPGMVLPEATAAIRELVEATYSGWVPRSTMELVHLRTSQVNGCSFCVSSASNGAKRAGETDDRLFAVAAWREAPWFDPPEHAALAPAESMARPSDRPDPVPDAVWDEAARHYDERQMAALVIWIATCTLFNRVNVTARQPAGDPTWE
jgi:AhpD family alkylhydroperoxidase